MAILLPLKGVSPSKADILTTNRYIKVSYAPYLFEVYLKAAVEEERSAVRRGDGAVEFRLIKKEAGLWGRLAERETEEDRRVMAEKRAEAVEAVRNRETELAEARAAKKREEERLAVREQMKLEQEERERIERVKQEERERADRELERFREQKREEEKKKREEAKKKEETRIMADKKRKQVQIKKPTKSSEIWSKSEGSGVTPKKAPPPPRGGGSITVQFTPRVFPTAARESKEAEEQEWLARQAAARRIVPRGEGDPNERNPELLKDRGIAFFRAKDYESAINVFSEAISFNPALPQLFSNRAACHLAMGNTELCVSDCCRALELYYPAVASNQLARAKVFARRGSAYANTGELQLALQDYEEAVRLMPGDEALRDNLSQLRKAVLETN